MSSDALRNLLESAFERFVAGGSVSISKFVENEPDHASLVANALLGRYFADAFPHVGESVLHFQLLEELGEGRFAKVFLAEDLQVPGSRVALKVSTLATGEQHHLGAVAGHPNVVRVLSSHEGLPRDLTAIAMEYVPGRTLDELVPSWRQQGPAPVEEVVVIGVKLAEALDHAHRHGIVHRDVKPANVLIGDDGEPRLFDFNLASREEDRVRRGATLAFTSPEGLRSLIHGREEADPPAGDVFALAATLYFALTGRPPWVLGGGSPVIEESAAEMLEVQRAGIVPIGETHPHVDGPLARLLESTLVFDPAERIRTASDFARRLRGCLGPLSRLRRARRRSPRRAAAVAVACLAAFTVGSAHWSMQPTEVERWRRQAELAVQHGDLRTATRYYGMLIERGRGSNTDFAAIRGRGLARLAIDPPIEALHDLTFARAWYKDEPALERAYAYALLESGHDPEAAIRVYRRLVESGRADAATWNNLGCAEARLATTAEEPAAARERARECFLHALSLDVTLTCGWENLKILAGDDSNPADGFGILVNPVEPL